MPGQRAPGQKLINVPVDDAFLKEINEALKGAGYSNRAAFVRDAIVEKLLRAGYKVTVPLSKAPPRFGKEGKYPEHRPGHYVVHEATSSGKAAASAKVLKKGVSSVLKPGAK